MSDDHQVCKVVARRKGRDQNPCTLIAGYVLGSFTDDVVLRTLDVSGRPPLVALLTPEQARTLGKGLIRAANILEGKESATS